MADDYLLFDNGHTINKKDLKPNSKKYKEEQKKEVKAVVNGAVKTKKRSVGRKLSDLIIERDFSEIREYVIYEVLIPGINETILDLIKTSAEMMFTGSTGRRTRSSGGKTSYEKYYGGDRSKPKKTGRPTKYGLDEIIFDTREDAEEVLEGLSDLIEQYEEASVSDYKMLASVEDNHTDRKYGWYDLGNAGVIRLGRDQYAIKLPRPEYLE